MEVLEVVDSRRAWRSVTVAFELMMPESWSGYVVYDGARHWLGPGMLFCPGPGDTFELLRAQAPGSFRVLMLEREVLGAALAKHGLSPESLAFHGIVRHAPAELLSALRRFLDDICGHASTSSLQASWHELGSRLATQLERTSCRARPAGSPPAERVRQLIHAELGSKLDLGTLTRGTGLSRFQMLRAFKRAYGLPPHAYQLCYRIARAKRLLSQGHRPAYVATELCFADQSHLNRHFKRLLGVTPSEYAQGATDVGHLQRKRAVPVRLSSTQL